MAVVTTTINTPMEPSHVEHEDVFMKLMKQNLEGVMFHIYMTDLYDFLELEGFKKMHKHQVKEENHSLDKLKHIYIEKHKKIPHLKLKEDEIYKSEDCIEMSHEKISDFVKHSMEEYAHWEVEVLEHLLKWKHSIDNRELMHEMIEEQIMEIHKLETVINILEEHNYNYECICELSDYLKRSY